MTPQYQPLAAMVAGPEGPPTSGFSIACGEKWKTETHGGVERFIAVGKHWRA